MEELEDPTEKLKEINEAAEERREAKEKWITHVALGTAIIAVFAAIAGLIGNHHANEAMLLQIKSSDQWNYYQAKGIKYEVANTALIMLHANGKEDTALQAKMIGYGHDKEKIMEEAKGLQEDSEHHMREHLVFAKAITLFQIAIAISAVAILTRRKPMWYACIVLFGIASYFMFMGFFTP